MIEKDSSGRNNRVRLFVRPRNKNKELWEGPICGDGDDGSSYFGVELWSREEFGKELKKGLGEVDVVVCEKDVVGEVGRGVMGDMETRRMFVEKWGEVGPGVLLERLRVRKSKAELGLMRESGRIISGAINLAMACTEIEKEWGGVAERNIEAMIEYGAKVNGAQRMAFPSVVGSGENGTVLHYMANDAIAKDGDMVMVDAGCLYHGYSSDISRSWPINGKFSSGQREIYQLVLDVQKRCVAMAKAKDRDSMQQAASLDDIHFFAAEELARGLMELKILKGASITQVMDQKLHAEYYPHAIGHYLGVDVHDTHDVSKSTPLVPGMVVTIEPGLYVKADDERVPEMFRGIGIRIEDDIAIGVEQSENLTADAVKEVKDIENLVGSGPYPKKKN